MAAHGKQSDSLKLGYMKTKTTKTKMRPMSIQRVKPLG